MRALLPFLRLFKFAKLPFIFRLGFNDYRPRIQYWLADHIGLVFSGNSKLRVLARYLISSIHRLLCVGLLLAAPFSAILKS